MLKICKHCGNDKLIVDSTYFKKDGEKMRAFQCKTCKRRSSFPANAVFETSPIEQKQIEPDKSPMETIKVNGLTLAQLRAKHDMFFIIGKTAGQLEKDNFIPEPEFLKLCNIRGGSFRHIVDSDEMQKYRGRAGGITYWSHPESITQMKREAILT